MSDQVKPHHIALLHSLSKFVSAIVILVGCLVLLGWLRMKGQQAGTLFDPVLAEMFVKVVG